MARRSKHQFGFGTWLAILMMAIGLMLQLAQPTAADLLDQERVWDNLWQATTLDLATLDTANHSSKNSLFSIQGLVPDGFAVASLRLHNSGEQTLSYTLQMSPVGGDTQLCSVLTGSIAKRWQQLAQGPVTQLSYAGSLESNQSIDLLVEVALTQNASELQQKTCLYNVIVAAQPSSAGSHAFFDEEILQNQITTGSWAN